MNSLLNGVLLFFVAIKTLQRKSLKFNQRFMKITYYGQSCFGIETNGKHLLFDPFISPNELAKHIVLDEVPCDYMLISHGHEDHIADAEYIAKNTNCKIISNFEIVSWFQGKGLENGHPMNTGGNWSFDFGKVKMVNAVHSSVLPDGTYAGNPIGFIIEMENKRFYYSGDTALHMDMKLIGEYWQPDLAFLPIGDNFTMGVDDAIIASEMIQCDQIIGMHYDTFGFIEIDQAAAIEKFKSNNKTLQLISIGDSIEI